MEEHNKHQPREWQKKSERKIDRCIANEKHNIVPVNACVGSGKTDLAAYAFGKFIDLNRDKKTIQMFVTPRIKLCKQQTDSIAEYISAEFGLVRNKDFAVVRKDCSQNEVDLHNENFCCQHAIFVVCDESLWGIDKNKADKEVRWHSWSSFFKKREAEGYIFGNVALDEAHNYTSNYSKIIGSDEVA